MPRLPSSKRTCLRAFPCPLRFELSGDRRQRVALLARPDAVAAKRLYARMLLAAAGVGSGLALAGAFLGPWLVGLLYGEAYRAVGGSLVGWLFLALVIVLPSYVLTQAAINGA